MGALTETARAQSLALLATLAEARQTYGLRHDDYERYRSFCTRRIQRLRAASGLCQQAGKVFEKKPIELATVADPRHVLALAFTTERYWAHASDLLEQAKVVDSVSANQKRRHALKKLKNAAASAEKLELIVTELARRAADATADADAVNPDLTFHVTDVLEARAYARTMVGRHLVEKHAWQDALDSFVSAKSLYENLAKLCADDHTHAALAQAAIDAVEPQVRYCMYTLAKRGQDVDALVRLIQSQPATGSDDALQQELDTMLQAATAATAADATRGGQVGLTFLGEPVPVRSQPIARLVLQARELEAGIAKLDARAQKLAAYQTLISALIQAERLAQRDVAANAEAALKVSTSTASTAATTLQNVAAALAYARRVHTAQRNLLLLDAKANEPHANGAPFTVASAALRQPKGAKGAAGKDGAAVRRRNRSDRAQDATAETATGTSSSSSAATTKHYTETIRLLETVLQNLTEIADLAPIATHPVGSAAVDQAVRRFRAMRSRQIAIAYAAEHQWAESRAAARAGIAHLAENRTNTDVLASAGDDVVEAMFEPAVPTLADAALAELEADLTARAGAYTTAQQLLAEAGKGKAKGGKADADTAAAGPDAATPLSHALFSVRPATEGTVLQAARPRPLPMPAKPVFFDLAYNEIDFPDLDAVDEAPVHQQQQARETPKAKPAKTQAAKKSAAAPAQAKQEEESASGITGWLGGLWGRK
ncbi:signal recognition particle subunit srp68 [Blastocladiella emersonii ATCC 22665]|nr:signal recognition particle subunit srp68 [Blastocladiella emersonii ATCC 22665]